MHSPESQGVRDGEGDLRAGEEVPSVPESVIMRSKIEVQRLFDHLCRDKDELRTVRLCALLIKQIQNLLLDFSSVPVRKSGMEEQYPCLGD